MPTPRQPFADVTVATFALPLPYPESERIQLTEGALPTGSNPRDLSTPPREAGADESEEAEVGAIYDSRLDVETEEETEDDLRSVAVPVTEESEGESVRDHWAGVPADAAARERDMVGDTVEGIKKEEVK
jgi:hypothetical protein